MRLSPYRPLRADVFEEDRYGPAERMRRRQARENVWWRRHLRWIGRWPVPLRVIIVLFEIAIAYAALVAGLVLGIGLRALY